MTLTIKDLQVVKTVDGEETIVSSKSIEPKIEAKKKIADRFTTEYKELAKELKSVVKLEKEIQETKQKAIDEEKKALELSEGK